MGKPLDGYDIWPALSSDGASPRKEMLYNVNPLCNAGQAASPKAGLRVGDFKVLAWCYSVKGIDDANSTGPISAPKGGAHDPEFAKGPVLYNHAQDPSETTNLANDPAHALILKHMLERLAQLAEQSVEPMQWVKPYQGKNYECADCPLHPAGAGVAAPWLPWIPVKESKSDN